MKTRREDSKVAGHKISRKQISSVPMHNRDSQTRTCNLNKSHSRKNLTHNNKSSKTYQHCFMGKDSINGEIYCVHGSQASVSLGWQFSSTSSVNSVSF